MSKVFLKIPSNIYGQIMGYVMGCDIEISGMGQVKYDHEEQCYIVTRVHLPKQACSGVETELDADALAELEYECEYGKYKNDGDLLWWWHSHVDMGVFWSATDHTAIKQLSSKGLVIATVFNKKLQLRTAYAQGANEGYPNMFADQLVTAIVPSNYHVKAIEKQVSKKVVSIGNHYSQGIYPSGNRWNAQKGIWEEPMPQPQKEDMGVFWSDTDRTAIKQLSSKEEQYDLGIEERSMEADMEAAKAYSVKFDALVADAIEALDVSDMVATELLDDYEEAMGGLPEAKAEFLKYVKDNFSIN